MESIILLLCLAAILLNKAMSSQAIYYVIDDDRTNPCPSNGAPCHSLSHYANSNWTGVQDDVTFILMEGKHTLNTIFNLTNFNRVSLIGQSHQWIDGSQWPARESTVYISCNNNSHIALYILNTSEVYLEKFTITNCYKGAYIIDVNSTFVKLVSIQNNGHVGLFLYAYDFYKFGFMKLIITNSSFHKNCLNAKNTLIKASCADVIVSKQHYIINISVIITFSTFSSGWMSLVVTKITSHSYKKNTFNNEVIITNCLFFNNTGIIGGIYINLKLISVLIKDSTFLNNTGLIYHNSQLAVFSAGAVSLLIDLPIKPIQIIGCLFKGNNASAGSLRIIQTCGLGNNRFVICHALINDTTFIGNYGQQGSAISIKTVGVVYLTNVYIGFNKYNHHLPPKQYSALYLNCDNHLRGIIVFSNVTIYNNNMTGMVSVGCVLVFRTEVCLVANNKSPVDGGGFWIDTKTFIIGNGIKLLNFSNNTAARYGGAIYSDSTSVHTSDMLSLPNDICQFTYLSVTFNGNNAGVAANDIYGGRFYGCLGKSFSVLVDFVSLVACNLSRYIIDGFPKSLSHHSISSKSYGVCYCDVNETIYCSERSIDVSAYPGQWINLSLVTVGNCGGINPGVILTTSHGLNVTLGDSNQQTSTTCKVFNYKLKQTSSTVGQFVLTTGEFNLDKSSFIVKVNFKHCPFGLKLSNGDCTCDDIIGSIGNVTCNISTYPDESTITRFGNNWLYNSHQHNCTIVYENCPFDYCNTSTISLTLDNPDVQCSFNRSGILCGQCQAGLSLMLGSNRCDSCSNYYLFLIPVFIIAGLVLIFILLRINLTTSMGTINGLLFYANIMKLNNPVILPHNTHIPVLTQFIAWLNLDFGFDVCFFNGLDGYWKTWLQYTFSCTLIVFIVLSCKFSGKLSRLFGRNVITALSTLIFMANTKLMLNIRNALMISPIECNDRVLYVWSVDGNINYLSGKHIPLVIVSLLFLLTGLIYTLIIFSSQWLQKYGGRYCRSSLDPYVRLQPFIDAETGPYKDKYRYYRGIHLIIYLILTAVFAYTTGTMPHLNNYITAFVSFMLLIFIRGGYKAKLNTCLEFFYILNLGVTSFLNTMNYPLMTYVITMLSISLSLVVFVGIVLYHTVTVIRDKCGYKCKCISRQPTSTASTQSLVSPDEMNINESSSVHVVNRRESLIYDM